MQFARRPTLVIFDKDGTLIDFVAMWGTWAEEFIVRVCDTVSPNLRIPLYAMIGMDPVTKKIQSDGALAIAPEATTQREIAQLVQQYGVAAEESLALVQRLWQAPDPTAAAVPCTDLPALCAWIRAQGCLIAVATADNRAPTQATLQSLGIAHAVSAIVLMGKAAGVMACVGVTTGVCQQSELAGYADIVLAHVGQLYPLWP